MKAILKTSLMTTAAGFPSGSTIDTDAPGCPLNEVELRRYIDNGLATPVSGEPEVPEKRANDRKEKR